MPTPHECLEAIDTFGCHCATRLLSDTSGEMKVFHSILFCYPMPRYAVLFSVTVLFCSLQYVKFHSVLSVVYCSIPFRSAPLSSMLNQLGSFPLRSVLFILYTSVPDFIQDSPCIMIMIKLKTAHYITLRYITLHCVTLHCVTLLHIT